MRFFPVFPILLLCPLLVAQSGNPTQALREAARLDSEGKCAEAEAAYRKALDLGPPSLALLNNFGNHFLACGDPEKARPWFERVLKANSAHPNANLQLARLETEKKNGAGALSYLARVTDTSPAVQLLRAEANQFAGKRTAATALLDAIDKQSAGDPAVLFQLGLAAGRMGLYDRAEKAFNTVAATHPNDFDVLANLGRAAARAGHYERAQRALDVAVKLQPGDPGVLFELGLLAAAEQQFSRAVFVLAQAAQRAPQRADIQLALARASENAGYYGDAALAYDRYLQLEPADEQARRDRALVQGLGGKRIPEAIAALEAYCRKHPDDSLGHYGLARLLWKEEPAKALEQLTSAIRLKADFAPALLSRAWLLHRSGRIAEALPDLETANRLVPANPRVLAQMGLVYSALDRPADAERVLRQAISRAPDDSEVLLQLGRVLMALGREQEAQSFLERFQKLRPQAARGPLTEAGMIELAGLPAAERLRREIERLRQDVRTHPGDIELQAALASLLLRSGQTEEASAVYRELLARTLDRRIWLRAGAELLESGQAEMAGQFLEPVADEPGARLQLAAALFESKGAVQAVQALEAAPAAEQNSDYFLLKARLLEAAGDAAGFDRALEQGLRTNAASPKVAVQTAQLLVRHGRTKEASEFLLRSAHSAPDSPELRLAVAITLALTSQQTTAASAFSQLEQRWPEWEQPYLAHALLLKQLGRTQEARRKEEIALALGAHALPAACGLQDWFVGGCTGKEKRPPL